MDALIKYRITLDTRKGLMDVDVLSSQGPEAAGRRANLTLVHTRRYGDIDQVHTVAIATVCGWFAACDNISTGAMAHPILGDVPICDRCRAKTDRLTTTLD